MDNDVKNGNLQMVDLMKFILAILVITIHSSPLTGSYEYILTGIIARIAVPFFFISSGYILYTKLQANTLYIRKYIKSIT